MKPLKEPHAWEVVVAEFFKYLARSFGIHLLEKSLTLYKDNAHNFPEKTWLAIFNFTVWDNCHMHRRSFVPRKRLLDLRPGARRVPPPRVNPYSSLGWSILESELAYWLNVIQVTRQCHNSRENQQTAAIYHQTNPALKWRIIARANMLERQPILFSMPPYTHNTMTIQLSPKSIPRRLLSIPPAAQWRVIMSARFGAQRASSLTEERPKRKIHLRGNAGRAKCSQGNPSGLKHTSLQNY